MWYSVGSSAVTCQSFLFHSYKILLIVICILMEPLVSLCCHAVRNLFFNPSQLRFSNTNIPFHQKWSTHLDLSSVPFQPQLLEGFEGRGRSCYLCDNSFLTKMCAISKFSIYHPISSLYSRGLLRRWPTYFRYIKMTRYTLVFSSHKSLWSE